MAAPPVEKVRGHLTITVHEASGKNKEEKVVWDPNFVEGFVKVEIRGGAECPRNVKVQSNTKRVVSNGIDWGEKLHLEVLEGATELRIMLCREKKNGQRIGTSVVAACGIFVADILDAVPIDKYFELFKPGVGGEGGFIRIGMTYTKGPVKENGPASFGPALSFKGYQADVQADDRNLSGLSPEAAEEVKKRVQQYDSTAGPRATKENKPKGGFPVKAVVLAGIVAGLGFAVTRANKSKSA